MVVSPLCPRPSCAAAGCLETREHAIMECPDFADTRRSVDQQLRSSSLHHRPLCLNDVLGAVECYSRKAQIFVLGATARLLLDIDRRRHL